MGFCVLVYTQEIFKDCDSEDTHRLGMIHKLFIEESSILYIK